MPHFDAAMWDDWQNSLQLLVRIRPIYGLLLKHWTLSDTEFAGMVTNMRILGFSIMAALIMAGSIRGESAAEDQVREAIKAPDVTVVHLWAPWCSNCQVELKSGGWAKMVKENRNTKFVFVSVWNNGNDGHAMLEKFGLANQPNVTITADPGPRTGDAKIKQFLGLPLSWIPTTWVYKGGDLRYALNYGEIRFPVLQQFLADSESEWSHKGEAKLEE
jgi:thiol-disulfide isomerase/thioredoxin